MPIVLAERDYKLVTLFSKVAGIFLFAAGTVTIADHGRVWLGLGLVLLGTLVTLAPVPISVVQPDSYAKAGQDDELTVAE